ncbi:MAG: DNA mismatch repair endonuclease MutL [Candidatus Eisenbacteria bacterium]|nr:DNA mismatch repair endonuclease MutL [Candidatus Eisenbacteria bacterium]
MTRRIRTLSEAVSNMIAAGEVIEGPFSVVKELVENAIDAGADELSIEIKGGGSDLILVSDNGVGMDRDDAVDAFKRYATSKLSGPEDLEVVETLGFRGEALPSIASVSRVRVVTCEPGSVEGTEVSVVGGELRDVRPAGRAPGTTVEVSSLFFNTPARRKFLRSDRVETRKVVELLTEYAVLYPAVRFDVAVDGKLTMNIGPSGGLRDRVGEVLGQSLVDDLFPISASEGGYAVSGLAGKPSIARARGALQIVAVNGRPIGSRLVGAAVRAGYGELLPRDRHPVYVLLIDIDPALVDVNVHPTKREVRFGDTRRIFGLVEAAVRKTLMSHDSAPRFGGVRDGSPDSGWSGPRAENSIPAAQLSLPRDMAEGIATQTEERRPSDEDREVGPLEEVKFWQLHHQYIFVQTREGVLLLDQHAAHERVVYEEARRRLTGAAEEGPGQQLLFPVAVDLSPQEWSAFEEVSGLVGRLGFSVRPMSGRTVMIESVPGAFPRLAHETVLKDILNALPSGASGTRDYVESIARTFACRTAIKAGDRLREEEMRALVDQLFATELPYSCPHGRPTFMRMTLEELDKRFGRT